METLFRNSRRKLTHGLLFWREVGAGLPIVFLHGAWNDGSQWVSLMEVLSRDFHCLTLDLLGFGESETPDIHYSIDLQVDCLAEFLDTLRLGKVYLVGHSLGGWIAASYALKYPERTRGVVLLAPEGVAIESTDKRLKQMQTILERSELMFALLRFFRPIAKVFGWKIQVDEEWKQRLIMERYPTACELLFQRQIPEIHAELLDNKLPFMTSPVLILQGGKDSPEVSASSEVYAQSTPGASLKMIAHGGNDLAEACSGVVAEEIRDFINNNNNNSRFVFNE